MLGWIYLILAIAFEVAGTTCMKLSEGLTHVLPSVLIFVFYGLCFLVFPQALKKIEVGIAYAVWAGLGAVFVATVGVIAMHESISYLQLAAIGTIIVGVIGLKLSSGPLTEEKN
jgi:small multidrug resistance pump